MSNTLKIVDRIRETTETGTDYAVAKALGMTQSNLKPVLLGKAFLGDKAQRLAAQKLGLPFDDINALVNEDKAKTESERSYWRGLCTERVRTAINAAGKAAACLILATGLNLSSGDALAEARYACNENIHYAHWLAWVRRVCLRASQRLCAHLRGLAGPIPRVDVLRTRAQSVSA